MYCLNRICIENYNFKLEIHSFKIIEKSVICSEKSIIKL